MEENFLLLFRFDNPLDSSVEFMKVRQHSTRIIFIGIFVQLWYQYDTDGSGYIEADELKVDSQRIFRNSTFCFRIS